jgi:aryl-alcohol dehydrogenase-like predicted oxidoreductase
MTAVWKSAANWVWLFCPGGRSAAWAAQNIGETGALSQLASELGVSPQRVVLAWHLAKYDRLIPIPGASRPKVSRTMHKVEKLF